jgi:predicted DNA-binding protein
MARLGEKKPDALRERVVAPLTNEQFERLKDYALRRGLTLAQAVREMIERATAPETVK